MKNAAAKVISAISLASVAMSVMPGSAQAEPGRGNGKGPRVIVRDHRGNGHGNGRVERDHRGNGRVVVRDGRKAPPQYRGPVRPRQKGVIVRDHRGQVVKRNGRVIVRARPGIGYGRDGRIVVLPARSRDDMDAFAAEMFVRHASNLSCGELGNLLRSVSNEILSAHTMPAEVVSPYDSYEERLRKHRANRLKYYLTKPIFAKIVMERLTMAFEGCDQMCFDDGVAIGIISGTGYCHASLELGGIDSEEGFRYQEALPVCQTANFVGCQQGYSQAVNSVPGCLEFASGSYMQSFNEYVSNDCHIDNDDAY